LRKAAATIRGLDWQNAETPDGRRIFGPHRRQALFVERECAVALLDLFQRETGHRLYDYVGALLAATFPSLESWGRSRSRYRNLVKKLVGERRGAHKVVTGGT